METNFNKVSGAPSIRKPKGELVIRNKTLSRNLRTSIERRYISREIPPLTPLHRLRRFKAIRDKNLNKDKKLSIGKKSVFKMEDITTAEVHAEVDIRQEESAIHVLKESSQDVLDKNGQNSNGKNGKELANGVEENEVNGTESRNDKQFTNGIEEEGVNGEEEHLAENQNLENRLELKNDDSKKTCKLSEMRRHDEQLSKSDDVSSNTCSAQDVATGTAGSEKSPVFEHNKDIVQNSTSNKDSASCGLCKDDLKNEVSSDDGSVSSSSTFPPPNKFLTSSSDDVSETAGAKDENSEDEEIDVDRMSTKSSGSTQESVKKDEERIAEAPVREAKPEAGSRIPRSVFNSGSSYKTAYGSVNRISGRRAVSSGQRGAARKRKAEEQLEPPFRSSPSQPSPRWKFFRPSISNLWSPRKTPYHFSITSTPSKNYDDSMTVNIGEDTLQDPLNDSDLFYDADKTPSSDKKSRWGCILM